MAKKPIEFTFDKPKTWAELFGFGPQVQKQAEVIADQQKNALIDLYPQDYVDQQLSRENQQIEWAREDQLNDERLAAEERARISRENLYGQPSANPIDRARSVTVEAGSTPSGAPVGFETVSDTGPILRRVPEPPKSVGPLLSSAMTSMPDIGPVPMTREEALAQSVPVDSATTNSVTAAPVPGTDYFPDAPAAPEQKKGIRDTILETLGFSTPEAKQAFAMGLIASGGASLSAAAEGYNGWGSTGKGLQAFGTGYKDSITTAIDGDAKRAAIDASRQKQIKDAKADIYNQRMAQIIANGQNGNFGMTAQALNELAQMAIAAGDGDTARKALEYAQQVQQAAAKEGQIYNHQSGQFELAPGIAGGHYQVEQAKSAGRESGELPYRTTTDLTELDRVNAERSRNGLPPVSAETWIKQAQKGKGTNINVETGPKDGAMWAKLDEERAKADGARGALTQVYEMQKALPNVTSGFGANQILIGQKFIAAMGGDPSKVADTETFKTQAMEMAARMKGDLVGNAQISDSDMRFVQMVAGGDITLDKTTLERLLNIREKSLVNGINRYNERIESIYPDLPENKNNRIYFGGITVPERPEIGKSSAGPANSVMSNNGKVYIRR